MQKIISEQKSIVVAADVDSQHLGSLANGTKGIKGIGAYKIGFNIGLQGLAQAVYTVKSACGDIPVIYDHQKAGNDIPRMGDNYAKLMKASQVDAAILFPFTGPATQEKWTKSLQDIGVVPIMGGIMTHENFLASEGGYIADDAPERIYRKACKMGVSHFVVPGNKVDWVQKIRGWLIEESGEGNFVLYAPGFITQGGEISNCGHVAGNEWHAIIGSDIYGKDELNPLEIIRGKAEFYASQILSLAA